MPQPVHDLCADILGGAAAPDAPALPSLQAQLQEAGILELQAAAARAGITADVGRQTALAHPHLLGYLPGPPEVLYLRVAGLRRA
jgi:DUF1365 family protein